MPPEPAIVGLTPVAKKMFVDYFNRHNSEQIDLTGDLAAAWSKLEEYAARLALVVHSIRCAAGESVNASELDDGSMRRGIELAEWFKHEARRAYAMFDATEDEYRERQLLDWIIRRGGWVTARDAQRGCSWLKKSTDAEKALDGLVKSGYGDWIEMQTTERGGRPTRVFRLPEMIDTDKTSNF
jgi:hypothetical protein